MNPSDVDEIKRHFNVVAEGLQTEIKLVAEGVVGTNQRLDGVENAVRALDKKLEEKTSSLDGKIDRGFSETQALIKQNYSELDQRIGGTEARLEKLEEQV